MRLAFACLILALLAPVHASGGEILSRVKARGTLVCGVSSGMPGFSETDASGRVAGIDADFCRAVAAAALGDPDKVNFKRLEQLARFSSLMAGEIDLLAQHATYALGREAQLKISFVGPYVLTGQRLMVRSGDQAQSVRDLDGASVCLAKGTTHEAALDDIPDLFGARIDIVFHDGVKQAVEGFFASKCRAVAGDGPILAALRQGFGEAGKQARLLPETLTKEPLSPVVRRGDDDWLLLNKAVLSVLIGAEEAGLTREMAAAPGDLPANSRAAHFIEDADILAKPLGIVPGFARRVVAAVGNYGEIFERNLGEKSPVKYERGYNKVWNKGGLLFGLPF